MPRVARRRRCRVACALGYRSMPGVLRWLTVVVRIRTLLPQRDHRPPPRVRWSGSRTYAQLEHLDHLCSGWSARAPKPEHLDDPCRSGPIDLTKPQMIKMLQMFNSLIWYGLRVIVGCRRRRDRATVCHVATLPMLHVAEGLPALPACARDQRARGLCPPTSAQSSQSMRDDIDRTPDRSRDAAVCGQGVPYGGCAARYCCRSSKSSGGCSSAVTSKATP